MINRNRIPVVSVTFVWIVLCFSAASFAQTTSGTILGEVRDASGAVVPGAAITITNLETGISRTATTDQNGRYRAPNLPVGTYRVAASFAGFKNVMQRGITLAIGQDASVNLTLEVGDVTERVEVTSEAPMLETHSAVVGGLVDQKSILELPLNGRSFIELATLRAGAADAEYGGKSVSQGYGNKISLSGGRFTSNLFLLDGTVMNDSYNSAGSSAGGVVAGVETVREFKVITNAYSAEYGQHTGGVINAVTRQGTNQFHGSVYEFLRNDNLDAARWEDNARGGGEKPEFRRNQFGASAGGPVRKDKTFFFFNYEGLRENVGESEVLQVPDENARRGILPNLRTPDPNDVLNFSAAPGFAKVKPFFEKFWPLPPAGTGRNLGDGRIEYSRINREPAQQNFFSVRVDHSLSANDSFFVRYTSDRALHVPVTSINALADETSKNQFLTLQYDRILSPTVLNSLNLGYTRTNTGSEGKSYPGFERVTFTEGDLGHAALSISGIAGTGSGTTDPRFFILNNYQVRDDMTWNRGSHTWKIGGNLSRLQHNDNSPRQPAGQFNFDSLELFLQNEATQALISLAENYHRYTRQSLMGLYFQDDYQMLRNFTLNWGVRWEAFTSPHEIRGNNPIALEERFFDPTVSSKDIQLGNSIFVKNPSWNSFAPRVGVAWDPFSDGKMSVRGGAGIFFEPLVYWTYRLAILHTAPIYVEGRLSDLNVGDGISTIDFPNAYFTQRQQFLGDPRYESIQKFPNQPYVAKFSLEIQRQVTPTLLLRAGYSGTRGVHLGTVAEQNGRRPNVQSDGRLFFPTTNPVQNPNFGRTRHRRFQGTMDYHSMRVEVEKRISAGLQLQGAYTLAKNVDDGTSITGSTDFDNDVAPRYYSFKDRGLSALDVRHVFTLNFVYDLPGKNRSGVAGRLMGGWRINGLTRLNTGQPFSVVNGFDRTRSVQGANYPDLVAGASNNPTSGTSTGCRTATGQIAAGIAVGTPDLYFNPCSFALPEAGFLGNLGRNTLISPGRATFDFSMAKSFSLAMVSEDTKLEFRGEFFNLFNRPNFRIPSQNIFDRSSLRPRTDVARIDNTLGSARQIQFALKLTF